MSWISCRVWRASSSMSHDCFYSFVARSVAFDRGVHRDIAAPLVGEVPAKLEIFAARGHLGLACQLRRPMAEIVAVPWRLRRERRQAKPLPDRLGVLHEFAPRQRYRRVGALERGIDQHGRALAAIARPARTMAGVLVRNDLDIVLRLAAVGHRPEQGV